MKYISWDYLFLRRSLTVALGAMLCLIVTYNLGIPSPFMAMITITVIPLVFPNALMGKGLERIAGGLLGSLAGVLHLAFFHNGAPSFMMELFITLLAGIFIGARHYLYAALTGMVTYNVMLYQAFFDYSKALSFMFQWNIGVWIGLFILSLCYITIWPKSFLRDVILNLRSLQNLLLRFFRDFDPKKTYDFQQIHSIQSFLDISLRSSNFAKEQVSFLRDIRYPVRHIASSIPNVPFAYANKHGHDIPKIFDEINSHLKIFFKEGEVQIKKPLLESFEAWLVAERKRRSLTKHLTFSEIESLVALPFYLKQIYLAMELKKEANDEKAQNADKVTLFTKRHFIFACRFALAVMLTRALMLTLQLPAGVQPVITCLIILIQPNDGRAARQALLRFLGISLGLAFGAIVVAMIHRVESFAAFCLLYSFCIFIFSYWGMRSERYSYVFLQAVILFSLLFTFSPENFITSKLTEEGLVGVFIGFLIPSFVIYLWPMQDPWSFLGDELCSILRKLGERVGGLVKGEMLTNMHFDQELSNMDEIRDDLKYYRSKNGYRVRDLESIYARAHSIASEGAYLSQLKLPKEMGKLLQNEVELLRKLLLNLADKIDRKEILHEEEESIKLWKAFLKKRAFIREKGITLRLSVEELQNLFAFYSTVENILNDIKKLHLIKEVTIPQRRKQYVRA